MAKLLQVQNVSKSFQKESVELSILKNINFDLEEGEEIALCGASGSGKSTFLHLLGGLESPTQGKIFFAGQDLSSWGERDKAKFRGQKLGFIFQFHHLLPLFTALENVMMPLQIAGKSKEEARKNAQIFLEKVGLAHRAHHYPKELSGGESQRVAVARALVHGPKLILADEPTGNLDSENSKIVFDLLLKMKQEQGASLIIVTHNPILAERMSRQLMIQDGYVYSK